MKEEGGPAAGVRLAAPNVYAYGLGNPLAHIDPLGLCAWELASKADYGTLRGWGEGAVGLVGGVALTADAAFNLIPGKAAASAAIKTGAKEAVEFGAKAVAKTMTREASGEIAEKAAKTALWASTKSNRAIRLT